MSANTVHDLLRQIQELTAEVAAMTKQEDPRAVWNQQHRYCKVQVSLCCNCNNCHEHIVDGKIAGYYCDRITNGSTWVTVTGYCGLWEQLV